MPPRRSMPSFLLPALGFSLALTSGACSHDIIGLGRDAGSGGDGPDGSAVVIPDLGRLPPDLVPIWESRDAFCAGGGPVVVVGDNPLAGPQPTCTGQIAGALFQNALCTCEDVDLAGYLKTRAFNSAMGGNMVNGGGAVGINGSYAISAGYSDVGGSFSIAGPQSLNLVGYVKVSGDFRLGGAAVVGGYTNVLRDGWFAGDYTDVGQIDIGRDLHHAGNVLAVLNVKGQNLMHPVTITPPCSCGPMDILDVNKLVDDARTQNDNAAVNLSTKLFDNVVGKVSIDLPCGRFWVDGLSGLGDITVNVNGRVALFVGGDVAALGILEFKLAPAAELDLFIEGNLSLTGKMSFGDKSRPAATRIYVGGNRDIVLIGAAGFVGNLYAPNALVTAIGYADVFGSVFAKSFRSPGYANFLYDLAITTIGNDCSVPPPTVCTGCGQCQNGQTCIAGMCGPCTKDADCCGLDVCNAGTCGPLIQ